MAIYRLEEVDMEENWCRTGKLGISKLLEKGNRYSPKLKLIIPYKGGSIENGFHVGITMKGDPEGEWVKFKEIKDIIKKLYPDMILPEPTS